MPEVIYSEAPTRSCAIFIGPGVHSQPDVRFSFFFLLYASLHTKHWSCRFEVDADAMLRELLGFRKSPQEALKKNLREIERAVGTLTRESSKFQSQEKAQLAELKKYVKEGKMVSLYTPEIPMRH